MVVACCLPAAFLSLPNSCEHAWANLLFINMLIPFGGCMGCVPARTTTDEARVAPPALAALGAVTSPASWRVGGAVLRYTWTLSIQFHFYLVLPLVWNYFGAKGLVRACKWLLLVVLALRAYAPYHMKDVLPMSDELGFFSFFWFVHAVPTPRTASHTAAAAATTAPCPRVARPCVRSTYTMLIGWPSLWLVLAVVANCGTDRLCCGVLITGTASPSRAWLRSCTA